MSFIKVGIQGQDFSKATQGLDQLNEYNDESLQFGGILRRGNLTVNCDNNNKALDSFQGLFFSGRNHKQISLSYIPNNPRLNPYIIFKGVIDEGATQTNIKRRNINLFILDYLALLEDYKFSTEDARAIDNRYFKLRGTRDIRVNKHFIACFLFHYFSKDGYRLNNLMNVFKGNSINSYPSINAELESIFPPADSYYASENANPLDVLLALCQSVNSYLFVDNNLEQITDPDTGEVSIIEKSTLKIKNRPVAGTTFFKIPTHYIISIQNRTEGHNKVYNSVIINDTDPYSRQSSIDKYGPRTLRITSYAPPSQTLADSYLDYYSEPRQEMDMEVKMNHVTLSPKVGELIMIDTPANRDNTQVGITKKYAILSRTINFQSETILWRLKEA